MTMVSPPGVIIFTSLLDLAGLYVRPFFWAPPHRLQSRQTGAEGPFFPGPVTVPDWKQSFAAARLFDPRTVGRALAALIDHT
tara:strand:+ start:1539 stop:1784 length:246 start_codon:yes stop_codon:yes gene_type:complete